MVNVTPTLAQRVACLVAYDGLEPCELEGDERDMAYELFGPVERFPAIARAHVFALCGGRAGKTYVLGALRLVHGAYVRDLSSLAPGENAVALSIAPSDFMRQQIINYQLGCIRSVPELKATIVAPRYLKDYDRPGSFSILRPDGQTVAFEGGVSTRGGYGGRARSLTDCLMDECAFFQDAAHTVNDQEIFKAASPRVLPGGQMIAPTTAWAKTGYHWERWRENSAKKIQEEQDVGAPKNAISIHASTTTLRPAATEMVERERSIDGENARREFDAIPQGSTPLSFFREEELAPCFDDSMPWPLPPAGYDGAHPEMKTAGADFGFRSNSSALAITHKAAGQVVLANIEELRPAPGMPLRPRATADAFVGICQLHEVGGIMADGHYRESIVENLGGRIGLVDAPVTPSEAFIRARSLIRNGVVRMPNPKKYPVIDRLVRQLKETKGQALAGGGFAITLPLWPDGSHGDLAAAFVLSLYQFGGNVAAATAPKVGTEEWEEAERKKRRALANQRNRGKMWT